MEPKRCAWCRNGGIINDHEPDCRMYSKPNQETGVQYLDTCRVF